MFDSESEWTMEGRGARPHPSRHLTSDHRSLPWYQFLPLLSSRKIKFGSSNFTKEILNTRSLKYVCSANYFSRDPATRGYFIVHRARNDGKIIFKFLTVEDERWFIHGHKKNYPVVAVYSPDILVRAIFKVSAFITLGFFLLLKQMERTKHAYRSKTCLS